MGLFLGAWTLGSEGARTAQRHDLPVEVTARFQGRVISFDQLSLTNRAGQAFSISRLDFLLSDFALHRPDGTWVAATNRHAYLNLRAGRSSFAAGQLPAGEYDRVRFLVGVDEKTNHGNPAQYSANHPLNPNLNNLHWSWAGGYIFLALEGTWIKPTKKLGGYSFHLGNDPVLMHVDIPVALKWDGSAALALTMDLDALFSEPLAEGASSTHARDGDLLAVRLADCVERAFEARMVTGKVAREFPPELPAASPAPRLTPWRFTFSSRFPIPDLPRDNPLTVEGVELGRRLFSEKLLSGNGQQACASCHQAAAAFTDAGKRVSTGAEGQTGTRNAMPLFNLAWKQSFFWDGRAATLREQVMMPIENPLEMHETPGNAVDKLARTADYPARFAAAFGSPEITPEKLARALEQFLLSQVAFDSKFDRAMDGRDTLSGLEKRGLELFFTEYDPRRGQFGADCFHCHGGPFFTSHGFANNGLDELFADDGRAAVTKMPGDQGKFSVPSLRNVAVTGPSMHDGRLATLEAVIDHYRTGVKRNATLDPNLAKHPDGGVPLSDGDKAALVAFLKTLTDNGLSDSDQNTAPSRLTSRR
jgi:cytochrome c peroxidase